MASADFRNGAAAIAESAAATAWAEGQGRPPAKNSPGASAPRPARTAQVTASVRARFGERACISGARRSAARSRPSPGAARLQTRLPPRITAQPTGMLRLKVSSVALIDPSMQPVSSAAAFLPATIPAANSAMANGASPAMGVSRTTVARLSAKASAASSRN